MNIFKLPDRETIFKRLSSIISEAPASRIYSLMAEQAGTDIFPLGLVTLFVQSVNTATEGYGPLMTLAAQGYIPLWIDALVVEDKDFAAEAKKKFEEVVNEALEDKPQ